MDQEKFQKYIIGGLVGLNIAVLAFFLLAKPPRRPQPTFKNNRSEVIEMLHLNNQQAIQLNKLADVHKQKMQEISEHQAKLLLPYFESLVSASQVIEKDSLFKEYQQSEREKIELTYQHLQEIKSLLEEDQLPDFKEFMTKTTNRLLLGNKKNPPPPQDFD